MPRFGDLTKRAKDVSAQASVRVGQLTQEPTMDSAPEQVGDDSGGASRADITEAASWLRTQIEMRRPAAGPVQGTWSLGLGGLLASHPRTPGSVRGLIGKLDRYGGLTISESGLGIDNSNVTWGEVTEIRTQNVIDYLMVDGVSTQLDSLPVPRFPGRKRLVSAVSGAIVTLLMAAAEKQIAAGNDIRIPAEVEYRGMLRSKKLAPGILAALLLTDPAVNRCFVATATANAVRVQAAASANVQDAEQRAATLKAKLATLQARTT